MSEPLPAFRYHPDPVRTGSIVASGNSCACCGQARGYVYADSPYTEQEVEAGSLCPWCIADGSAHEKYDAEFVDAAAIPDDVPEDAVSEIVERTPGYASWQGEKWLSCCDDAAAFLGPFGYMELMRAGDDGYTYDMLGIAMTYIMDELDYQGRSASLLVESLERDKGPTAYVFRCLECQQYMIYIDFP